MIGSLLVGIPGPDGLEYAGKVGTGFTGRSLRDLAELLQPLAQKASPLAGAIPNADAREAHWVKPAVVGEVRFAEWTRDGRLRHLPGAGCDRTRPRPMSCVSPELGAPRQ